MCPLASQSAAQRGTRGGKAMEHHPEQQRHDRAHGERVQRERNFARARASQDGLPATAYDVHRDLHTGVARANDQHRSSPQLLRIAVLTRMELQNVRPQVRCKSRDSRLLPPGHRHDDVVRFVALVARGQHEMPIDVLEVVDASPGAHW